MSKKKIDEETLVKNSLCVYRIRYILYKDT